jgi:hypothetical protein
MTFYHLETVSPDNARDAKRGGRLLLTFGAMANVQRERLTWCKVPNLPALAAATLAVVEFPDCLGHEL